MAIDLHYGFAFVKTERDKSTADNIMMVKLCQVACFPLL